MIAHQQSLKQTGVAMPSQVVANNPDLNVDVTSNAAIRHSVTSQLRSVLTHQECPHMSDNHAAIATADVLTLLLHNQHALAAAIEEIAVWATSSGSPVTHGNVIAALATIDMNASAITDAINKIRQA